MNTTTPSCERLTDLTCDSTLLGTDADGNDHHWLPSRRTAWIVDDNVDVQFVQRVDDLGDYVEHVRHVAGDWTELQYDDRSMVEFMTDLATGVEVQG